jgi:phage shock protein A
MVQFFKRLVQMVRGKSYAALEHFEKPEQQLAVFVEELNGQIHGLQRSVSAAMADEKKLRMQVDDLLQKGVDWEKRAELAYTSGDTSLAKEALFKKEECDTQAEAYRKNWEVQRQATEKLKDSLSTARTKVEEAKRKYTVLVARYKAAETNKQLQKTLSTHVSDSPLQMMERLNDKILKIEAENEANIEMIGHDGGDVDLESKFAKIERQARGDEALKKLAERMKDRKQIEGGKGPGDRVDDLKKKLG